MASSGRGRDLTRWGASYRLGLDRENIAVVDAARRALPSKPAEIDVNRTSRIAGVDDALGAGCVKPGWVKILMIDDRGFMDEALCRGRVNRSGFAGGDFVWVSGLAVSFSMAK